jgi:hypothetical protein
MFNNGIRPALICAGFHWALFAKFEQARFDLLELAPREKL